MSAERVERRLTALLAADVAGYSRLMSADVEGTLAAPKAIRRELVDPWIVEHSARRVETTTTAEMPTPPAGAASAGSEKGGTRVAVAATGTAGTSSLRLYPEPLPDHDHISGGESGCAPDLGERALCYKRGYTVVVNH